MNIKNVFNKQQKAVKFFFDRERKIQEKIKIEEELLGQIRDLESSKLSQEKELNRYEKISEFLKGDDLLTTSLKESLNKIAFSENLTLGLNSELKELEEPKPINSRTLKGKLKAIFQLRKEQKQFKKRVLEYNSSLKNSFFKRSEQIKVKHPESISTQERQIIVNDTYKRIYYLADLPLFGIMPGVLYRILNCPIPMTISIHVKETVSSLMIRAAKNTRAVYEAEQVDRQRKGKNRKEELDLLIDQANEFIDNLVSGSEKAYLVSIYVSVEAKEKDELLKFHTHFKNSSEESLLSFNTYSYGQHEGYLSTLPLMQDLVKKQHVMQTSLVTYLMPFLTKNVNDPDGIFLGRSMNNGTLVLFDIFKARNANINILGTSGSGKSVTAKLIALRLWLRQVQIIILDPEGEYTRITESVDGEIIKFSRQNGINPFYIGEEKEDYNEHIQILKGFFKYFVSENNYDQAVLDEALIELYKSEKQNFSTLFKILGKHPMVRDLKVLEEGSLAGLFNSERKLDLKNDWITFDLSQLDNDEYKKPAMFLLASIVSKLIKTKDRRRMLFIDEAHLFLEDKNTAFFYKNLVKRARKYKAGIVSITQNVEDYFNDTWNVGKGILTNAETTFLLKQSFASLEPVAKSFVISDNEKDLLPTLAKGEVVLFREKEHMRISMIPLKSEQELVFT